jgi:hypothetical protein
MRAGRNSTTLRYLDAAHVRHPTGTLADVEVRTENAEALGRVDGIVVEPSQRKVRYVVVERPSLLKRRRYMVPVDGVARLDAENQTIEIDSDWESLRRFDPSAIPGFADDDLIETMFAAAT